MSTIAAKKGENGPEARGVCAWQESEIPRGGDLSAHQYELLRTLYDSMAVRQDAILMHFELLFQAVRNLRHDLHLPEYDVPLPPPRRSEKVVPFK